MSAVYISMDISVIFLWASECVQEVVEVVEKTLEEVLEEEVDEVVLIEFSVGVGFTCLLRALEDMDSSDTSSRTTIAV